MELSNALASAIPAEWVTITVDGQSYAVAGIKLPNADFMSFGCCQPSSSLPAGSPYNSPSAWSSNGNSAAATERDTSIARARLLQLEKQLAAQDTQIATLQHSLKTSNMHNKELQAEHIQHRERNQLEVAALQATCESLTTAASRLQSENRELLRQLEEAHSQVRGLNDDVTTLQSRAHCVEEERDHWKAAAANLDSADALHLSTTESAKQVLEAAAANLKRVEKEHKKQLKRISQEHNAARAQLESDVVLMASQVNTFAVMQDKLQSDYRQSNTILVDVRAQIRAHFTTAAASTSSSASVGTDHLLKAVASLILHYEAERRILQTEDTLERQLFLAIIQASESILGNVKVSMNAQTAADVDKRINVSKAYIARHPVGEYFRTETLHLLPDLQEAMNAARACLPPLVTCTRTPAEDSSRKDVPLLLHTVAAGGTTHTLSVTIGSPSTTTPVEVRGTSSGGAQHPTGVPENAELRAKLEARMQKCRNARKAR
jgi:hypothetical protein